VIDCTPSTLRKAIRPQSQLLPAYQHAGGLVMLVGPQLLHGFAESAGILVPEPHLPCPGSPFRHAAYHRLQLSWSPLLARQLLCIAALFLSVVAASDRTSARPLLIAHRCSRSACVSDCTTHMPTHYSNHVAASLDRACMYVSRAASLATSFNLGRSISSCNRFRCCRESPCELHGETLEGQLRCGI